MTSTGRVVSFSQSEKLESSDSNHLEILSLILHEVPNAPTNFNLGNRDLINIPPEICQLVDLERIGLNNNRLTSLPLELSRLTSLRYVNLRANSLKDFPSVLSRLPRLEVLDLSRNKIRRFPEHVEVANLLNLKVLSVSRNRISSLPKYLSDMQYLKVLRLDNNPIIWPPPHVLKCENESAQEEWVKILKHYMKNNDPPPGSLEPFSAQEYGRYSLNGSPQVAGVRSRSSSTSNMSFLSSEADLVSLNEDLDILQQVYDLFGNNENNSASWTPPLSLVLNENTDARLFIILLEISKRFLQSTVDLYQVTRSIVELSSRREIHANDADLSYSGLDRSLKILRRHMKSLYQDLIDVSHLSSADIDTIDFHEQSQYVSFVGSLRSHITQTVVEAKLLAGLVSSQIIPAFQKASGAQLYKGILDGLILDWVKVNIGLSSTLKILHDFFLGVGINGPSDPDLSTPSATSPASSTYRQHKRSGSDTSFLSTSKSTGVSVSSTAPVLPYPSHLTSSIERHDSPDPFRTRTQASQNNESETLFPSEVMDADTRVNQDRFIDSSFFHLLKGLLAHVEHVHVFRTSSQYISIQDRITAIDHVMKQISAAVDSTNPNDTIRRNSTVSHESSIISLESVCLKQGIILCSEMRDALKEVRDKENVIDHVEWDKIHIAVLDCIRAARAWISKN